MSKTIKELRREIQVLEIEARERKTKNEAVVKRIQLVLIKGVNEALLTWIKEII